MKGLIYILPLKYVEQDAYSDLNLLIRIGATTPSTTASIEVTRSLINTNWSNEGEDSVLIRYNKPKTMATALRAYTSGLVSMGA